MTRPTSLGRTRAVLLTLIVVLGTIPAPAMAASSTTVELSPATQAIGDGETTTYDVVVTNASGGVGAWEFTASVDNTSAAKITDVTLAGSPGQEDVTFASDNSSVHVKAALADTDDTGEVAIATVTVRSVNEGRADLSLNVDAVGDEAGTNYDVTSTSGGTLTIEDAKFTFDYALNTTTPLTNESIEITGIANNTGGGEGTTTLDLVIDGEVVNSTDVTVSGGASETVTFTTSLDRGDHEIGINEEPTTTVTALAPPTFSVDYTVNETTILTNESVAVTADVTNNGDVAGTTTVNFTVNGTVVGQQSLTVNGTSTASYTHTQALDRGDHTVSVNELPPTTITVQKPADISLADQNVTTREILSTEPVNATAYLNNTGDLDGTATVDLVIDGSVVESKEVTVPANTTGDRSNLTAVTFSKNRNWATYGNHSVSTSGFEDVTVTVRRPTNPDAESQLTAPRAGGVVNTTSVEVGYTLSNVSTGIDHAEYRVDDGSWQQLGDLDDGTVNATSLTQGRHTVELRLIDNRGDPVGTSSTTFNVDTQAPTADITATGPVGPNTPIDINVLSVDTHPNKTVVEVRDGATVVAQTDVTDEVAADTAAGDWNATLSWDGTNQTGNLPSGTYTLAVVSTDAVGQTTETTTTITVDTDRPDGAVTGVSDDTGTDSLIYVNDSNTITVTGTASDPTSSIGAVTGVLESNETTYTEYAPANYDDSDGTWAATVDVGTLTEDGTYSLDALVTDTVQNIGKTGVNDSLTVVVDRTAPSMGVTISQEDSDSGRVNISASEPLQATPTATIHHPDGTTASIPLSETDSGWTGTFDFTENGAYRVTVTGTDLAGNTGQTSATTQVQTNVQTKNRTALLVNDETGTFIELHTETDVNQAFAALTESDTPLAELSADLSGSQFIDGQLGERLNENLTHATVGIPVNESELAAGVAPEDVEIRYYNETEDKWQVLGETTIETRTVNGTERRYYITNVSHFSTYGAVAQDTTPPSIDGSSLSPIPSESAYDYDQNTVTATIEYADTQSGVDASATKVWVDGTLISDGTSFDGSLQVTSDYTTVELENLVGSGDHTVTVQPVDKAGNAAPTETKRFTVAQDTTAPDISTSFTDDEVFAYGTKDVSFGVDLSDAESGVDASSVVVTVDGNDVTGPATVTASGASYTATGLDAGAHTFVVEVSDDAGNTDTLRRTFTIEADTTEPTLDHATITPTPDNGIVDPSTSSLSIDVGYSDAKSGVDASGVVVEFDDGSGYADVTDAAIVTGEQTTFTGYDLDPGTYTFRVTIPDEDGNDRVDTRQVTIGTGTSPQITDSSLSPAPGGKPLPADTSTVALTMTFTDSENDVPNSGISASFDGSPVDVTRAGDRVTYEATGLESGTNHTFTVELTDQGGNTVSRTTTFEIAAEPDDQTETKNSGGGGGGGGSLLGGTEVKSTSRGFGHVASIEGIGDDPITVDIGMSGAGMSVSELTVNSRFKPDTISVYLYNPTLKPSEAPPLADGEPVAYFRMTLRDAQDRNIKEAGVTFTVAESVLPADADPAQVTLYRYTDGSWTALDTQHIEGTTYEAVTPGFSEFAIGIAPPESQGTGDTATTTTAGPTPTTTADPTSTATSTTTPPPTTTETSLPGFGPLVALVALLALVLLSRRRHDA